MLLNCHTYYSFCYGTFSVEQLLDEVQKNGYDSFVLTDINNTSACLDAIRQTQGSSLKIIAGIDFRNNQQQQYIGIARNNEGFMELNEHLSEHLHSAHPFDMIAPAFQQSYVVYPQAVYKGWKLRENEFIGISIRDLAHLPFIQARHQPDKLVILHTVTFSGKLQFNAHRLLRSIDTNNLLSKLPLNQQAKGDEIMVPKKDLYEAYKSCPHIISNTERLVQDCRIHFDYGKLSNKNLKQYSDEGDDMEKLRSECMKGLYYRYPNASDEVLERINKELEVIGKLDFASYFLINWDIINYARHKNYYYVGRGSGSNSILAYLLRITDVDPIELDLYFERFINIHRNNAPDFDIDFSWTDRDDITRHIFERFGGKRTALLGAYNTFQHDAVIRELGKVFGLPPGEIDNLQKLIKHPDIKHDETGRLVKRYSEIIKGFPSHLSVHSSGIIISEEPITYYSATSMPPKGYPTTQFSMLEAEDIGLYKFDILSQRGLGKIKDTLALVKENKDKEIDIHNISQFKQDEKIKDLLRVGNTIGCFYVESPAMRMLLAKLKADDYLRLVAASSIIRPGVSKSGMMREYIMRFRDEKLRTKAREELPELYEILKETYGVMVYQEDVIKIAHLFADLSLAEADYLRRGMSWKFKQRNEFDKVKEKFFSNCRKKGYDEKRILDIWIQIESFANFAFSKGHSASYAVESYQALFLKAYYPLEYMVATLNNGGGFYRKELYIHEIRMNKGVIKPPCINNSDRLCRINDSCVYLGLGMIAELQQETIEQIIYERQKNGLFEDMYDFVRRVPVSIEQMRLLIRANCFGFTSISKKKLLWEVHALLDKGNKKPKAEELFNRPNPTWQLPELSNSQIEETFDEMELYGFPLNSPFELLRDPLPYAVTASQLKNHINRTISIVGYLINVKHTVTYKNERMCFGTFIDIEGHWIDTVHFPVSAKQYPFTGPGCYELKGKVMEEYDFMSIAISYMKRLPIVDRESVVNRLESTPSSAVS